jgi:antitoxin component YwqK of YwqJK toxin-antitoxin module
VIALAAALLLAGGILPPLACPAGAERRGGAPPEAFEEWCEAKDAAGRPVRHGPARTWYDDGRLWTEASFRDGLRDGPFVEWHRSGAKAREGAYAADAKVGAWVVSGESGGVEEESEWRDGAPHGRFVSYWPGGGKRTEGRHCLGAQCGTWRTWDASGREMGSVEYGEQRLAP